MFVDLTENYSSGIGPENAIASAVESEAGNEVALERSRYRLEACPGCSGFDSEWRIQEGNRGVVGDDDAGHTSHRCVSSSPLQSVQDTDSSSTNRVCERASSCQPPSFC